MSFDRKVLEYLKEAGDLFNWCNILEKEMSDIHDAIASKHKSVAIHENSYDLEENK